MSLTVHVAIGDIPMALLQNILGKLEVPILLILLVKSLV